MICTTFRSDFHVGWKNQNKHSTINSSFNALSKWHEPNIKSGKQAMNTTVFKSWVRSKQMPSIKLGPRSVLECKKPPPFLLTKSYQYIYLLELASFLFKTLLVQTTQVKNFRKVNTTFVLFFVSFLSNCVQDCMHWVNVG